MNPFAIVGAVAAAGYGIYKAATATKEVPPATEAALAQQALPIAVQQINAGIPPGIAAQIAAKVVVDAVMVPAGTKTTPYVDPNPPHVEGDPKAGLYYVRWEVVYEFPSSKSGTREIWVRYFATAAQRNTYFDGSTFQMQGGGAMPTNLSKGGPDINSNDFRAGLVNINTRPVRDWWVVTWTESVMLDRTRGWQEANNKGSYDSEAAATAKANELKAIVPTGTRMIFNIKVEKTTVQ